MTPKILLVDDEKSIRDAIKLNLEMEGYKMVEAIDGKEALQAFNEQAFDLVILDIMLPHIDGLRLCENFRLKNNSIPILFLSAKNTPQDRILGLKKGGDDYLTKPFDLEELILRVEKLIKRNAASVAASTVTDIYGFGPNKVNFTSYEAETPNGKLQLTKKEIMLLRLLIENRGEVVSREHIFQSVWGYSIFPSTRTIDNFILSFRKYFESDPKNPQYFHSIRGVGYKFTP